MYLIRDNRRYPFNLNMSDYLPIGHSGGHDDMIKFHCGCWLFWNKDGSIVVGPNSHDHSLMTT